MTDDCQVSVVIDPLIKPISQKGEYIYGSLIDFLDRGGVVLFEPLRGCLGPLPGPCNILGELAYDDSSVLTLELNVPDIFV